MKNKKGFTLVELLAVVVILAVIAIISIPIIASVIENSKKGAIKNSVYGLVESANLYYAKNLNSMPDTIEFEINDNKQVDGNPKLDYKGKIRMGYVMLFNDGEVSVCADDGEYVATKPAASKDITVEKGSCTGEWDDETRAYAVSVSNGGIMKISVRSYADKNALPKSGNSNDVAVISDTKVTDYYLSNTAPENPKEGMIWIVLSNSSNYYLKSDNIKLGVSYVLQYINSSWVLKMAYVYNDKQWTLLCYVDFENGDVNLENSNLGDLEITKEFSYTGDYQEFQAPFSGYYKVELWGAQGGTYRQAGGKGAYTKGEIYLEGGEKLYVYVGGSPVDNSSSWNGGAAGWAAGGGATDIRLQTGTNELEFDSLKTRIMVAGGGGGGSKRAAGGPGGTLKGLDGPFSSDSYVGHGGTQIAGGKGGYSTTNGKNGSFGVGGIGISGSGGYSGGGGGGYYGGGGGALDNSADDDGPGGGGSSYISGYKNCVSMNENSISSSIKYNGSIYHYSNKYFINTLMKSGNEVMPTHDGTSTMTGNAGSGFAKIKIISIESKSDKQLAEIKSPAFTDWIYYYTGAYQTFTPYKTGTYKVELWGAAGGTYGKVGGAGAYTSGEITLEKDKTYYIYVGGFTSATGGGWNGGGSGWSSGGGATDMRTVKTSSLTIWNESASLNSRIMIAGGGGGGSKRGTTGGAGGGLNGIDAPGGNSVYGGFGATQTAGGTNGKSSIIGKAGTYAKGADGVSGNGGYSGAGGGGYYGGGSGAVDNSADDDGPGGGGSSYISGHAGCIAVNSDGNPVTTSYSKLEDSVSFTKLKFADTHMIDGEGYEWTTTRNTTSSGMPTFDGVNTMTGNTGEGYAKITLLSID